MMRSAEIPSKHRSPLEFITGSTCAEKAEMILIWISRNTEIRSQYDGISSPPKTNLLSTAKKWQETLLN